jgi:hypothetical protein
MADPADIQMDLNDGQAGQVVQQNVLASGQTMLAFKVEQSKVPEFFGQKGKDTITAIVFLRRIEDLARTNTVTYTNVANTLSGFAVTGSSQWLRCSTGKEINLPGLISNPGFNRNS